ncbi:MAG TPA: S8/S53 family peptidase [Bacteroidia bacterium]|nr:S8/S53 family peptidase [Bacteroidia bacterium]
MKKIITSIGLSLSLLVGINAQANNGKAPHGAKPTAMFRLDPSFKDGVNYTGGHIIFKVKEQYRGNCSVSYINEAKLTPILNYLGVTSLDKLFPMEKAPKEKFNKLGQAYADLSLTYEIKFSNKDISLEKAINLMLSTGLFDYADPRYIRKISTFFPNDPNAKAAGTAQYNYLNRIKAYSAWDVATLGGTQGDTNVVIGIVDSGTDLLHPDLIPNFKHNYNEIPNNNIDDDHDGYIDNVTGWDLAGADYNHIVGDNLPQIMGTNNEHGSHVSGDASAATNNGIGVAGVGFNCKLLPVKCAADNDTRGTGGEGYIITGYEGIQYAAAHGAKVINCSWGGTGGSSYEQSIITAATINYNCIVVAAAGNDSKDEISYPAGYDYVLSVAATNANNDIKASFSNWNYTVDLSAPGNGIYNTVYSTTDATTPQYVSMSGTSMASPVTAGGVALVLSKFPTYTGMQAGQRLIVTTDNNYGSNSGIYANKLGSGRLNLYTAVASTVAAQGESVVFTNDSINDHNDLVFTQGDTLFIGGKFINYLNATSSAATASITAISGGAYVTGLTSSYALGTMNSNTFKSNVTTPFRFVVGNAPLNTTLVFQVKITDGAYTQSYFFSVLLNPDYVNITINQVFTTITSRGKIGWSKDGETGGLGFAYNGDNLLYEGGLMIGTSPTAVSDCIRGTSTTGASDTDFVTTITAHKVLPSLVSEFDVNGQFNDADASPVQNLLVSHNAYAWSSAGSSKFVIVEYIIKNAGTTTLSNLYAGIFADWDVDAATASTNKSDYDPTRMLGYTWATPSGTNLYAGMRLLTNTPPNFYAIDNVGAGVGGVNITTSAGFKKADKYTTLSTMRTTAGDSTVPGNDVCNVMSSGPFTIAANSSIKVAFALLAGDNLTDLQTSSDTAQIRYNGIATGINKVAGLQNFVVYPNPATNALNFVFNSTETENYTVSLMNTLGQTVKVMTTTANSSILNKVSFDVSDLATGAYMYKVTSASGQSNSGKVLITH